MQLTTPVFDETESEQNSARKASLLRLVSQESPLLFVGAGCSALIGYPTWGKLIKEIEKLAINCGGDISSETVQTNLDFISYAEILKEHIRSSKGNCYRYYALIENLFKPRSECSIDDFHRNLVQLPFSGIVTTNYDVSLEDAILAVNQGRVRYPSLVVPPMNPSSIMKFFKSLNSSGVLEHVLHIHGKYDIGESIVLSRDEYIETYGLSVVPNTGRVQDRHPDKFFMRVLWAIFATRRIVFIGFGLEDPFLEFLMSNVSDDLWLWDQPHHYAIMPINLEEKSESLLFAKRLRKDLSIEVVFYENQDHSFQGLRNLISEARNTQDAPTPETDWIEDVNRRMREMTQAEQR